MERKKEVLSLFPTPLYANSIPPELSTACNLFDTTEMGHEKESRHEYGIHSKNTYIMDEPECAELKKYVLGEVLDFAQNTLCYDYPEYVFSQTWVSWKEPGQFHTAHTHPNSMISAVFFYGYAEENTPAIDFMKPAGAAHQPYVQAKKKPDLRKSPFAWERFSINFQPGLLLIFPSHFMHAVPLNKTQYTRKAVSMNIVPKGGTGDPDSLTELRYDKVLGI